MLVVSCPSLAHVVNKQRQWSLLLGSHCEPRRSDHPQSLGSRCESEVRSPVLGSRCEPKLCEPLNLGSHCEPKSGISLLGSRCKLTWSGWEEYQREDGMMIGIFNWHTFLNENQGEQFFFCCSTVNRTNGRWWPFQWTCRPDGTGKEQGWVSTSQFSYSRSNLRYDYVYLYY